MNYTSHKFNQTVSRINEVIEVSNNDQIVLKNIYPKILYFTAKWCGPCQRISPVYKFLAESNPDIKFFKIDVDVNDELTVAFGVKSMPTFIFIKNANEYKSFTGADEHKLKEHIQYLIK